MTATETNAITSRPRFAAVGAGRMGRGIAIAFAWAGHRIALIDLRPREADAWQRLHDEALGEIKASLAALAQLGALRADQVDTIAARVSMVPSSGAAAALETAELVFEGVPERLDAKREAFAQLNRMCRADAILTSTTSSILITQLAALVERPERFLNIHWLNPAYVIPVVELSTHAGTSPDVLARAKALMESIGKLPVVCGPTPGYIVPRLQALVMNEAARMVEEAPPPPRRSTRRRATASACALPRSAWSSSSTSAAPTSCTTRAARCRPRSTRRAMPRRRSSTATSPRAGSA